MRIKKARANVADCLGLVEPVQARLAPRVPAVRARLDAVEAEQRPLLTDEAG